MTRKSYPSDVSEEEWHFVAPYLTLIQLLASLHFVVFAIRMLPKAAAVLAAAGSS